MRHSIAKIILATAGVLPLIGLTGCVVREHDRPRREREREVIIEEPRREREREVIIVEEEPPAPRREERSRRPTEEHVWVEGHWVRVANHWAADLQAY